MTEITCRYVVEAMKMIASAVGTQVHINVYRKGIEWMDPPTRDIAKRGAGVPGMVFDCLKTNKKVRA